MGQRGYATEEIVRRGEELYQGSIRARVEPGNEGMYLVIDIESGDFEVAEDHLTAGRGVRARHPKGVFYGMRIGYPALAKIGGSWGHAHR
jgi:hypothetical protein